MKLFIRTIGISRATVKIGTAISPTTCSDTSSTKVAVPPHDNGRLERGRRTTKLSVKLMAKAENTLHDAPLIANSAVVRGAQLVPGLGSVDS